VTLSSIRFDAECGVLELAIRPDSDAVYKTEFVGTLVEYDKASKPRTTADGKTLHSTRKYSQDVGKVLATVSGLKPQYKLTGDELYVRAVVTSSRPHLDPSTEAQDQQSWTHPVGW
jgi:hypothetical protein